MYDSGPGEPEPGCLEQTMSGTEHATMSLVDISDADNGSGPIQPISRFAPNNRLYTPLPPRGAFRLLEILPGAQDATLACRLHVCLIGENRDRYHALSYTWTADWEEQAGTPAPERTINCNGVDVAVGWNLYMALRHLRRQDSARALWADAICINQADDAERSQQVAAMGDIFRNARSVLVWIGPVDGRDRSGLREVSSVFTAVCSVVSMWAEESKNAAVLPEQPSYHYRDSTTGKWTCHTPGLRSLSRGNAWSLAREIYKKRWFRRLWVFQEIALARDATVIWGDAQISWQWVGLAAAIMRTGWPGGDQTTDNRLSATDPYSPSARKVPVGIMNAYLMYRVSRFQVHFEPLRFTFCELLALTRQFQCADERDKIYGLLSVPTTDSAGAAIRPDYSKSPDELYRDAATAMLRAAGTPDFLPYVRYRAPSSPTAGGDSTPLPSWVPQWSATGPQTLAPLERLPAFSAAGAAAKAKPARLRRCGGEHAPVRLAVHGRVLDKVSGLADDAITQAAFASHRGRCCSAEASDTDDDDGCTRLLELERLLTRRGRHTGPAGLARLARTLTAGKSWYGTPVVSSVHDDSDDADADADADADGGGTAAAAAPLADFAACLLSGRMWWALADDAFGPPPPASASQAVLKDEQGESAAQSAAAAGAATAAGITSSSATTNTSRDDGGDESRDDTGGGLLFARQGDDDHDRAAGGGCGQKDEGIRFLLFSSGSDTENHVGGITVDALRTWKRKGNGPRFLDAAATACLGRRPFRTASGMLGIGPAEMRNGDSVCVVYGLPVPFVIRRDEATGGYRLVGECYVDEIVRGEAVQGERWREEWVELV